MLPQIVRHDEAFRCSALHEYVLKVNELWARIDFLQLLSRQLHGALTDFSLRSGFRLELLLDDPVFIQGEALPLFLVGVRFVVANGLLHKETINLLGESECWRLHLCQT